MRERGKARFRLGNGGGIEEEQVAKMEAEEQRKLMGGEADPSMHGMTETEMYFLKKFIGS